MTIGNSIRRGSSHMFRSLLTCRGQTTGLCNQTKLKTNLVTPSADFNLRTYETLSVNTVSPYVTHVELNRPDRRNALNDVMWMEIGECFNSLAEDKSCRSIILSGAGKMFCAGIDLKEIQGLIAIIQSEDDIARKCITFKKIIRRYQDCFTTLEKCRKPVITCIHSGCLGAGSNLICGSDIRYCTSDSFFQIKEVDLGIAADVGAIQRMPRIVGNESIVRELVFTGRKLPADEALSLGLVGRVFPDKTSMLEAAFELGKVIASKSPLAVQGAKIHLNYSRDHTVDEGLDYQATWNMAMLQSEDLMKSAMAQMSKTEAEFSDF